ncbi:MAG: aminotransferase class I/II-fold pyridoxal phosphate-dependent enzyme [Bacteroidales bacterium]
MAALEQAEEGIFFSSGMAAISTILLTFLKKGDHAVFQNGLYGGTTHMVIRDLEKFGINWTIIKDNTESEFRNAILPGTRLIYIETPSNPLLGITDIRMVTEIARAHGILTVIDNTFASSINQNPVLLGVDLVMHSATKYLGGHSDICAGAVVSTHTLVKKLRDMAQSLGGSLNAQTCALLERSMKTLALRVEKQNANALQLARILASQPGIERVYYPGLETHPGHEIAKKQMTGFGGMLSFDLKTADATEFQNRLKLIRPSMSLGGVDSIICAPALTSHRHLSETEQASEGISVKSLRLSVGIEDVQDLAEDILQALE